MVFEDDFGLPKAVDFYTPKDGSEPHVEVYFSSDALRPR